MNNCFLAALGFRIFLGGLLIASLSAPSFARTFVIPHVLETSGRITSSPYSYDTEVTLTTVMPEPPTNTSPVTLEFYLYDNFGLPMRGSLGNVCNPCQIELAGNNRQTNITIGDLIERNGGGFDSAVKLGFGVFVVTGGDAERLAVEGRFINSLATTSNLTAVNFSAPEIRDSGSTKRTFVIPHILEKEGTIANTQFTFDTTLYMVYTPSQPTGITASASVYLYGDNGQPMQSKTGSDVCNPCQYNLGGAAARKVSIRIDDLITARGGFDTPEKKGFAVVVLDGQDPAGVAIQSFVVNSHTSAFDLSVFGFEPQPLNPAAGLARAYVIPHVLETSGTIAQGNTFDTTVFMTYTGAMAGNTNTGGAEASLYLYDNFGQPMVSSSFTTVCDPCTFPLNSTNRKQTIVIDDLISNAGGFSGVKLGYGVIVVNGSDPDSVNLSGFVVNSHTGPFDLSVFGFEPQPILADAGAMRRSFVIPHILEKSGKISASPNSLDTTLHVTFAGPPSSPPTGQAYVDLYLYDENGAPLRGAAKPVCAPCSYELSTTQKKLSLNIEDLIVNAGGFDNATKVGNAVVLVSGSNPEAVNIQGFVVNAHTGPFDVSVFGFEPQEIRSQLRILPNVTVNPIGSNLLLKWSTNSPGYLVEQKNSLSPDGWSPVGVTPAVVGREYCVTNVVGGGNNFYRLSRP